MNREDEIKLELGEIMNILSDMDTLSEKLAILGVEDCPLARTKGFIEKTLRAKQKELTLETAKYYSQGE